MGVYSKDQWVIINVCVNAEDVTPKMMEANGRPAKIIRVDPADDSVYYLSVEGLLDCYFYEKELLPYIPNKGKS